jgi:hypothetical protein
MAYAPQIALWAQRGRALTAELVGGNQEKLTAAASATLAHRALRMLSSAGHSGDVTFGVDSAYYAVGLLIALRKAGARFTVSVPRTGAMWKLVAQISEDAWADALDLAGAQVAEIAYAPADWKHEPLRMIVRRTRSHRGRDLQQPACTQAQDDPSRPARAPARGTGQRGLRLQLHPHRHPRPSGRLG